MRMATKSPAKPPARRPVNVSLRTDLAEQARQLGLNMSQACESGLEAAVKRAREAKWLEENREAIDYWNRYVDEHGLPLARYRQF